MIARERLASSGVAGLDEILRGGLPRKQLFVVHGGTGAGKTTLALQFLIEGASQGERALYLGFGETPRDLQRVASSHHWSLEGVALQCVGVQPVVPRGDYTLFSASEVELHGLLADMLDLIGAEEPERLVIDTISALRWFAADENEYRRVVAGFGRSLLARPCTTLLLAARAADAEEWGMAEGVIELALRTPPRGADRRQLRIAKLRGVAVATGFHDYRIATGGLQVFPRSDAVPENPSPDASDARRGSP